MQRRAKKMIWVRAVTLNKETLMRTIFKVCANFKAHFLHQSRPTMKTAPYGAASLARWEILASLRETVCNHQQDQTKKAEQVQ